MTSARHPELDLHRAIRPGLDILANEIVIALKKRTRFPANAPIYAPGLVRTDRRLSLLDYELARIEQVHAELGRYQFASQEAFTDVSGVAPIIDRAAPPSPVRPMASGIGRRVLGFYRDWIGEVCRPGTDPNSFGETVTADVLALLAILERVSLGKVVAESKFTDDPGRFVATGGERGAIVALIVHRDREAQVVELARRLAERYEIDPDASVRVFEFMIAATIEVEVDYIRMRIDDAREGRA